MSALHKWLVNNAKKNIKFSEGWLYAVLTFPTGAIVLRFNGTHMDVNQNGIPLSLAIARDSLSTISRSMVVLLKLRMGQVKNGHLYIRCRGSSQKNEAEELKKLTDYFPLLF